MLIADYFGQILVNGEVGFNSESESGTSSGLVDARRRSQAVYVRMLYNRCWRLVIGRAIRVPTIGILESAPALVT